MTALFVFLVLMAASATIFSSAVSGYRNARAVQRDTENAQYSLNTMAKELRTSSIAAYSGTSVRFYDYSQEACLLYNVTGGNLEVSSASPAAPATLSSEQKLTFCQTASLSAPQVVTTGVVTGRFIVTPSTIMPVSVGKVTASLRIAEGANHSARLQTTVSLRDYGYTGI